jgi:orotate phosphoribosyltransferase
MLNLGFIYVRPEPKKHGLGNQIEGDLKPNQHVVVIEDLISTGKSSLAVCNVLRAQNDAIIDGLCSVFSYGFASAKEAFNAQNIPIFSLCTYADVLELALEKNVFSNTEIDTLQAWQKDPSNWQI